MNVNIGDKGLIVEYIQMFLKKYYSDKKVSINDTYDVDLHKCLIEYLSMPDPVNMNVISNVLKPYIPSDTFLRMDGINKITYESRDGKTDVARDIMNSNYNLDNNEFMVTVKENGWIIDDYCYQTSDNKCRIIISKLENSCIPRSSLLDTINLFDKRYTEMMFGMKDGSLTKYMSSSFMFEEENYKNANDQYSFILPDVHGFEISSSNGVYSIINSTTHEVVVSNFRGYTMFTANVIKDHKYIIYINKKNDSSIPSELINNVYISYNCVGIVRDITSTYSYVSCDFDGLVYQDEDTLNDLNIVTIIAKETGSLCISTIDTSNIRDILVFEADSNYLNEEFSDSQIKSYNDLCIIQNKLMNINYPSPDDYFNDPWILHESILSYILGRTITEYSREDDILRGQELAINACSYTMNNPGKYDSDLKDKIKYFQDSHLRKDGKLLLFNKGYIDPDTEALLVLNGGV